MFKVRLRKIRQERKITQEELGKIIGLSQKQISHLEIGRNEPDIKTICNICNYFNISADYILGMTDTPKPLFDRLHK